MEAILTEGIYKNNDLGLVYVGTWGTFLKNALTMVYSDTKGDYVEFLFNGTGFRWYTQTNAWRGLAKVYVDNEEKAIVDTYSVVETMDVIGYKIEDLSSTTHTVKIEVLAEGNSKAVAYKVVIGKIEILQDDKSLEYKKELEEKQATLEKKELLLEENLNKQQQLNSDIEIMEKQIAYLKNPNGTTLIKGNYKNDNSNLKYTGTWGTFVKNSVTMLYSETKGDNVQFSFLGTGFRWYTNTNAWRGLAKVYIDSIEKVIVDSYSVAEIIDVIAYEIDTLDFLEHTVKIEVLSQGNSKTYANKVVIEKIEILQNITIEEYENQFLDKKEQLQVLIDEQEELDNEIAVLREEIAKLESLISGGGESPTVITVTSLTFEGEEVILSEGETYQLKWTIKPENATDKTVKFESGNTGFVIVDSNGLLTYVNEGETNICATTSNNISVYVKVTCKAKEPISSPVTDNDEIPIVEGNIVIDEAKAIDSTNLINEGIFIANEDGKLEIGDKVKIIAHILPYYWYNTNPYVLKSTDNNVIKINEGQVIEAVGVGNATVTAYTMDSKYKSSINYTVEEKKVLTINKVYNLEIDRFNIILNNNDESVAKNNSLGINSALQFCARYGYEKIVFPKESLIYIEPKDTINMVSDLLVDLNGSELKLRANNYERYAAINFEEICRELFNGFDLSLFDCVDTKINNESCSKFTVNSDVTFYSNKMKVKGYVNESEINQVLDYYNYGDKITLNYRHCINKKNATKYSFISYIEYLNDSNVLYKDKISNLNFMNTAAQYCTGGGGNITLRNTNDYNYIRIKIEGEVNGEIDYYVSFSSTLKTVRSKVVQNAKLFNGIITGERDEKSNEYPNWQSIGATEGGVSILFSEGYNNGIENMTVRKSIGFNMSSGIGEKSYGVGTFSNCPIRYSDMEFGEFDQRGNTIENNNVIRTKEFMDISKIKGDHYDIGYPLGYHGYPYVNSRICDVYFYDINKKLIRRDRGILRFRTYSKPENAYYAKFVFHVNYLPTSGNSDFGGAFAFFENFNPPIKNYIKNCVIEDNYSCGFAACGGQQWKIINNIWRRNSGRMPGCDIDWEDGWEYMQGDLVEGNSFESYNNCILCAGSGNIYNNNKFSGQNQFWGRSQYWSFTNNLLQKGEYTPKATLNSSTDCYCIKNKFIEANFVYDKNHSDANYDCYSSNEEFKKGLVLNGVLKTSKSKFSLGCGFIGKLLNNCDIENTLSLSGNITKCNIKNSLIKPNKDSSIVIEDSYFYNSSFNAMSQANDIVINNCIISRDKGGGIADVVRFGGTTGLIFNNCTFKFNSIDGYYALISGWDANGCSGTYTFNNCKFEVESEFKGYIFKFTGYPGKTDTTHITINFNNTDIDMFEISDLKGLNSNIVININ